ncbi:MAG: Flp pilus assembly complex ATPase component TadA [Phycisphaerales bacterium]|nr:MAG: Flp pilus assembly complex ATPase component TadA [Phycisphaerales bacterium]
MAEFKLTPIRGQTKPIDLVSSVSIGRGTDNTIPLLDEVASRQHCTVSPSSEGWIVEDLGSRNGTRVNEVKIQRAILRPGDVLRVGKHEWIFERERPLPGVESLSTDLPSMSFHVDDALPEAEELSASLSGVNWLLDLGALVENVPPKGMPTEEVSVIDSAGRPTDVLAGKADGPNAVRLLLQLASKGRATDIHVEPRHDLYHIRMRVDGDMVPIQDVPKRVGELSYGLIKNACNMPIVGRDAVQEGHFSAVFPDRRVEYRVSFTPSVHGQKLVVRVLDERGVPQSIAEIGMQSYMVDRIKRTCEQDAGLLLVCGPTGSGKTTTLYNCLRVIDRTARNVVTIEDPVEYQLDGVTQIPIDENRGNTFGSLLRSVLRQDPDVILVGEIRDEETARTAMQAAMTGHVVFSTIHAKDSISAVFRLLDLRVEPYLVANALDLVLAQRLVRVLCDNCKRLIPVTPGQATRMGRYLQGKTEVFVPTGCLRCLRTGYVGRRALFELLDFTDELRDIVLSTPSIAAMKKTIETGLFTTLVQSGWRLVAEGTSSLEEVDRVTAAAR